MNILLATKMMDMGGIERSVVSLARELRQRGHAVWVVSSGGYLVRELERTGAAHVTAPLDLIAPWDVARSAKTIRHLIHEQAIDLVHSFAATASVAVNLALRPRSSNGFAQVRLVSSPMGLQNSPNELPSTTWLRNWFLTLGAKRILVISPEIRRHLKRVGARDEDLIDFNFVGLDLEHFQGAPEDHASVCQEFGFPADAQIVSTIGALHPRKSHDLFVEAAAQAAAQAPRARFLVVGEGDLRAGLERRARAKHLADRLVFTGVRDDIPRLLSATDVYVKPGVVEGFIGITVLEAMALRKPVVAFETEDVKLALTDGQTGLLAANSDSRDLAAKIVHLLRDADLRARLGLAGRQVVSEQFAFGLLAEKLEAFYRQMLADAQPRGGVAR